jgi:hypothetical protein
VCLVAALAWQHNPSSCFILFYVRHLFVKGRKHIACYVGLRCAAQLICAELCCAVLCCVQVSYTRKAFSQTGDGHFSPIGGYHGARDLVLILDTVSVAPSSTAVHICAVKPPNVLGVSLCSCLGNCFWSVLLLPQCADV